MDCYFHHAVPSVAKCTECGKPVCASCRAEGATCASCRLASRIEAATAERQPLHGGVGPSSGQWWQTQPQGQHPPRRVTTADDVRPETRALVALGYPFWPLALLALFDPSRSPFVRRNAWQALGFNVGMYGVATLFSAIASIPIIGISAWPLLPFIVPVTIVASVVYAFKVWHGEDVHVPFVSELVDRRLHA